ncbi:hypothetical protein ACXGSC_12980, partial [Nocardia gipuzkoensis]
RRLRGGRSDASRAANGACSVSLRSKPVVGPVWARQAVTVRLELCRCSAALRSARLGLPPFVCGVRAYCRATAL